MPRGVKGSGKKTASKKAAVIEVSTEAVNTSEQKTRKPYPTYEERLTNVDAQIARLTNLKDERAALIAKTEAKLAERKDALAKSEEALAKALAKKEKIIAAMNKPAASPKPKLSEEERAEARRAALAKAREVKAQRAEEKKAEEKKLAELAEMLKAQGKTVDDLLAEINKDE